MYLLFSWFLCLLLHRLAVRISLPFHDYLSLTLNRRHPSSKNPHFQNEARCTTFLVKMNFICMRMKNHFHIKGWASTLVLKQRRGELENGLLNLFQELEFVIHWPDGYTMLIGLSPWTGWYSIFWWSLITTPLGRETGVWHILKPSAYGFAQKSSGVEIAVCQRPGDMALRMR